MVAMVPPRTADRATGMLPHAMPSNIRRPVRGEEAKQTWANKKYNKNILILKKEKSYIIR